MTVLNNPEAGIRQEFIPYLNTDSAAHTHGQVIAKDCSSDADAIIDSGIAAAATATLGTILGVVWDPQGYTVKAGDRGVLMTRGYHSAVLNDGGNVTRGNVVVNSATAAGKVDDSGAVTAVVGQIGLFATTDGAGPTATEVFVHIK